MNKNARKYTHAEAYCLMDYACNGCGRKQLIWNSRDGVTPFGTGCPNDRCEGAMSHVNWSLDKPYEALPADADRVVVNMTEEDARTLAGERIHAFRNMWPKADDIPDLDSLSKNIYDDGARPMIVSVEEYKRRAGIKGPERMTSIDVEAIVESLREWAEIMREGYGSNFTPEQVSAQADALEGAFTEAQPENKPEPEDFAKIYRFEDYGQAVIAIVGSSLKIFYQPRIPGILPVELDLLALSCELAGRDEPVDARRAFSGLNRERTLEIIQKAEVAILSETTSRETKH